MNNWIKCKDQLPPVGEEVLIDDLSGFASVASYYSENTLVNVHHDDGDPNECVFCLETLEWTKKEKDTAGEEFTRHFDPPGWYRVHELFPYNIKIGEAIHWMPLPEPPQE
jgi:hypothetical protein